MFLTSTILHGVELPELRIRGIFRRLGFANTPPSTMTIGPGPCLGFWIALLLERLAFLSSEQRSLILEEMAVDITKWHILTTNKESRLLIMADAQYVTWHGRSGFLRLSDGVWIEKTDRPPLETIGYNLAVLFGRNYEQCKLIEARESRDAANNPGPS
jgi:hypothetical protein